MESKKMTRRRVNLDQIADPRKRKNMFTKRLNSLTSKADDLSVLCGVEAAIIAHKPEESNAVAWPSDQIFSQRLEKFLGFFETDRVKKMVVHEKFLEHRQSEEMKEVQKWCKKQDVRESEMLMNEIMMGGKDLNGVDLVDLVRLAVLAEEKLELLRGLMTAEEEAPPRMVEAHGGEVEAVAYSGKGKNPL